MATQSTVPLPRINRETLHDLMKRALRSRFVQSGIVETPEVVDPDLSLEFYGLGLHDVDGLSTHLIEVVTRETGIDFQLEPKRLRKFARHTIGHYIEGSVILLMEDIPGTPGTRSSGPTEDDC